jgi:N utilization substance protein B
MGQNRHLSRIVAMQSLYEWDFRGTSEDVHEILDRNIAEFRKEVSDWYVRKLVLGVIQHIEEIDALLVEAAPEWPLEQIARVDKITLELAVYELRHDPDQGVPPRVIINEAVEIAKTFGGASAPKFINGVLGFVYRKFEDTFKPRDDRRFAEIQARRTAA